VELTRRWASDPARFAALANEAYSRRTGKALLPEVVRDAFARAAPTSDPLAPQLAKMARDAQALGFAPPGDLSAMVDGSLLLEIARR